MFNKKLKQENEALKQKLIERELEIHDLKEKTKHTKADLMRDVLGLPMVDFANIDSEGYPTHYLEGLSQEERKNVVADLAIIYQNRRFQMVTNYLLNLFGNHAIRKPQENDKNLAVFSMNGIRMVLEELRKAELEHAERHNPPEKFDTLAVLPDVPA